MDENEKGLAEELKRTFYLVVVILIGWTFVAVINLGMEIRRELQATIEHAKIEARSSFNKDIALRLWATSHGGVYVPVTERTPSSPYLSHIPERDILTPSGKKLTLMNPAYMLRQFMDNYAELYGVHGKITSRDLLNPDNAPDPWEEEGLQAFANGKEEFEEVTQIGGEQYLRLIQPLYVEAGCLKCHAYQGYRVGDLRGGVSVAVPMAAYLRVQNQIVRTLIFSHGSVWVLVSVAILVFSRQRRQRLRRFLLLQTRLAASRQQLSDETQRLDEIIWATNVGTWEWNIQTGETQFNERWAQIVGYTLDELSPVSIETWQSLTHPDDLELSGNALEKHFLGEMAYYECEVRMRHKDGQWVWVMDRGKLIARSGDGRPLRMSGTHTDISARKLAEIELRRSEAKHKHFAEVSPSGIWQTDAAGNIIYISPRCCDITGLSQREAAGRRWMGRLHPADKKLLFLKWIPRARLEGRFRAECRYLLPDGTIVWVLCVGLPEMDLKDEIESWVGTITDITELKQNEKALLENEERMSASLQEKEVLLREIHHRVKNNLQIISSLLQLQARGGGPDIVKALGESERRVKVMAHLHEKLYQSGDLQHVDIHGFLCSLVDDLLVSQMSQGQPISIRPEIEQVELSLDQAILIGQIFSELLSNAFKYAFPGNRRGEIRISLRRTPGGEFELSFADNGVGLPDDFDRAKHGSLGWKLIHALSNKLGARVEIERTGGTCIRLFFDEIKV